MVRRNKDGGYDLRTKEGREAQERDDLAHSRYNGCILRLVLLAIAIGILEVMFPSFGEWLNQVDNWLDQLVGVTDSDM